MVRSAGNLSSHDKDTRKPIHHCNISGVCINIGKHEWRIIRFFYLRHNIHLKNLPYIKSNRMKTSDIYVFFYDILLCTHTTHRASYIISIILVCQLMPFFTNVNY